MIAITTIVLTAVVYMAVGLTIGTVIAASAAKGNRIKLLAVCTIAWPIVSIITFVMLAAENRHIMTLFMYAVLVLIAVIAAIGMSVN